MEFDKKTIKYIKPNDIEIEQFKNIYRILGNKNLPEFIPTELYGKLEEENKTTFFTIYKDINNTNKICIVFYKTNNAYILYLDSREKGYEIKPSYYANLPGPIFECNEKTNSYISNCDYYLQREILGRKTIETHGLKKERSREYFRLSLTHEDHTEDTIMTKQVNGKYILTIISKQDDTSKEITMIWDDYSKFLSKEQPYKITIKDYSGNIEEYTKEIISYRNVKNKIQFKSYNQIVTENDINQNDINFIRKQTINGIDLSEVLTQILKDYFNHEIAQFKRKQIRYAINQSNIQNPDEQHDKDMHIHHHKM